MPRPGLGLRLFAYLVDVLPIVLLTLVVLGLTGWVDTGSWRKHSAGVAGRANFLAQRNRVRDTAFLVYLLYAAALEASPLRATIGKWLLGIRVVDVEGERLSLGASLLRNMAKIASLLPVGLGYWWAWREPEHRTWHDRLARAEVVRTREAAGFSICAYLGAWACFVASPYWFAVGMVLLCLAITKRDKPISELTGGEVFYPLFVVFCSIQVAAIAGWDLRIASFILGIVALFAFLLASPARSAKYLLLGFVVCSVVLAPLAVALLQSREAARLNRTMNYMRDFVFNDDREGDAEFDPTTWREEDSRNP
jgi:uncharacterized RDD family membrane protein YckC